MSDLLRSVDARTRLAGTNKLEILMFSLGTDPVSGRRETYGINVFKVREVMRAPKVTRAPEMTASTKGMISLRGHLVPVIDLAQYAGLGQDTPVNIMIVTEYNGLTQGFLVEAVDTILRLDWSAMRVPPEMVSARSGGLVNAVTELPDGRLIMMLDVEKILVESMSPDSGEVLADMEVQVPANRTVFFADDSSVARQQISRTLDAIHVRHVSAANGSQAWRELSRIADSAEAAGKQVRDFIQLVLTDVEMPEMDGYMLTRHIKADPRFNGVPVIMHSSLSGASNRQLGESVGIDEYVSKFEPHKLAQTVARLLS